MNPCARIGNFSANQSSVVGVTSIVVAFLFQLYQFNTHLIIVPDQRFHISNFATTQLIPASSFRKPANLFPANFRLGVFKNLFRSADFHHPSTVHQDDTIRHPAGKGYLMVTMIMVVLLVAISSSITSKTSLPRWDPMKRWVHPRASAPAPNQSPGDPFTRSVVHH